MNPETINLSSAARIIKIQEGKDQKKPSLFGQNIFVSNKECIYVINPFEILFIKAEGSYAQIQMQNGKKYLASKPLKSFLGKLKAPHFFRVHNSYIVNVLFIEKVSRSSRMHLGLKNGFSIPVSRTNQKNILNLLK